MQPWTEVAAVELLRMVMQQLAAQRRKIRPTHWPQQQRRQRLTAAWEAR